MTSQILQVLKQAYEWFAKPSFLLSISLTCFVAILLPTKIQESLGYGELIKPIQGYLGLVGIMFFIFASMSFLVHYAIPLLYRLRSFSKRRATLQNLTEQEKEYLAEYLKSGCTCLSFNPSDGVINLLLRKNVVLRPSNLGSLKRFDYCLHPWVETMLKKYPDITDDILKHYRQVL